MPSSNKVRKVTSENYPTDAGREGEAIFRRVYGLAGSKLPVKRLWISSMEDAAIQQGFDSLKDGAEYDNLFAASECRAKADWLIGMNGTRAFTKKYGRRQTIGRVQTPTLAMLTERQSKIQNFVKEPYYKVEITGNGIVAESERMAQEQDADTMQAACDGQCAVVGSMYRKELAVEQQREPEKPFVQQFYVVTDLQTNPMKIEKFGNLDDAMFCYQQVPNFHLKALGVEKTPDPLPGSLDIVQCKNGIDTIVEDYKKVPGWDNPYIQNHVVALVAEALKVQDVAVAYEINDGYFHIQTSEDGCDYTLYNKDFTVMDGGIIEVDGYRPVQEVMEEVLAEHGHSVSECGVISAEYLQEQSYRAETQRAEAMKEKLAAEKPAPEASISFYVAECAEFPVMGEFHDNLTLEQALEVYDKIPAERMNGIKSIGFSLEDGSIYSGMFDLMVGGEVQAEVVNHIQHYRESPLVQKAISDMKTLLEKRQASKELEERPNIRQSVREALKNRKKAQEQQPNQEQVKPKKAKKKGEMEL